MKTIVIAAAITALVASTASATGLNIGGTTNNYNNHNTNQNANINQNRNSNRNNNLNLNNNRNSNKNINNNSARSESRSSSRSNSRSSANNSNSVSNVIKDRLQPGNVANFGGTGPCTEGFALSVPGGGITIQTQCKEGKQQMKAVTVDSYFGKKSTRDYLCDSDKSLYGLDHCVQRRIVKSGVVQQRDRAKYGK